MKKIIYTLFICLLVFSACDPIEDSEDMGGALTADELDITATPIQVNGLNTNKIIVENNSAVLSKWYYGTGTSTKAYDTIKMVVSGTQTITFTGRNADGSEITKEIEVTIDNLYYEVDPEWSYLCGTGTKKWTWKSDDKCFGNGSYLSDMTPSWWTLTDDDMDGQASGEGTGASMVFSIDGATLTKNYTDGTSVSGTFSFDMTDITYDSNGDVWSKGSLSTTGVTVLCGKSLNEDGIDVNDYFILSMDDNNMVLAYNTPDTSEAWYWLFSAVDE